ncbi:MAG TPA: carboxypeptidase regulatory-like domain-containing protein [Blastocatellia bacterium]|nr:carboxypeptidase regulatory-like domain-containing protein [Blastocatellia bacterium]
MPKLACFILVLLCSSLTYAQSAATGSISGRITAKQQPLPGITVTLEAPAMETSGQPRKAFNTKTDSDGRYRFVGVPKGQHVVSPRAAAYVVPTGGIMMRAGKDVTVGESEQLEGIDFDLTKGGVITGKITDHTGRPMIQQRVALKLRGANNQLRNYFTPNYSMSQTDDRGVFRLYGLPAGQYLVSVGEARNDGSITVGRAGGYLPLTYYPGTLNEAEAKAVEVTEGNEVTDIDIKVGKSERTYEARGRIIDGTTGAPLIGVQFSYGTIMAGATPRIGSYGSSGERTNAQGEFLIQGVKPGKYAVFMQPEANSDYYSEPTVFELLEGDAEGLEIKAFRGASISGVVVVEGTTDPAILRRVKDVRVSAFATTPGMQAPSFLRPAVNPDGTFQLTGLRPGKNRLSATGQAPLQLLRIEREGVELPREVELTAGEQMTGVRVVMGYGTGVIRGQLNVVGGTLPPEARFVVFATKQGSNTIRGPNGDIQVDARGKFLVENLLPGEYDVRLIPAGTPGAPPMRQVRIEPQRVMVGAGEATVTFTLNLSEKKEGQQ